MTLGIYQAIGFREMCIYLDSDESSVSSLADAVSQTKFNTRKYAQRQIKWIRNKLLPAVQEANSQSSRSRGTHAYLLDATKLGSDWDRNVLRNAIEITNAFVSGDMLPNPLSLSETARDMLSVTSKSSE